MDFTIKIVKYTEMLVKLTTKPVNFTGPVILEKPHWQGGWERSESGGLIASLRTVNVIQEPQVGQTEMRIPGNRSASIHVEKLQVTKNNLENFRVSKNGSAY